MFDIDQAERDRTERPMKGRARSRWKSKTSRSRLEALLLNSVNHEKASVEEAFDTVGEAARLRSRKAVTRGTGNAPT